MKKLIFYILLIFFTLHVNAQVKENLKIPKNPKIGLSLSGGGAKGFAHIAVLKEIDKVENRESIGALASLPVLLTQRMKNIILVKSTVVITKQFTF